MARRTVAACCRASTWSMSTDGGAQAVRVRDRVELSWRTEGRRRDKTLVRIGVLNTRNNEAGAVLDEDSAAQGVRRPNGSGAGVCDEIAGFGCFGGGGGQFGEAEHHDIGAFHEHRSVVPAAAAALGD